MWALLVFIFVKVIVPIAISYAIYELTKPKTPRQAGPKPAGKDAFQYPTAEEGRPLPVLFGMRRIRGLNAVSGLLEYGTDEVQIRVNHRRQTVGFKYNIGLHLGVCHAHIEGIKQIWFAETCVWPTPDDPTVLAADGMTGASPNAPGIWGGYEREGGVQGDINIQYGGAAQGLDSYLLSITGPDQPNYRGFTGMILVHPFYIGSQPMLKPISVIAKRTDTKHSDGTAIWYAAKSEVGAMSDLNAIHILYELIFDTVIGLAKDTSLVGDSFTTAADTCYSEGFGLSSVWDFAPDDIASMIQATEGIIDGRVYMDPSTGKFEIGLVRDDYTPGDLTEYGPDDFWVESMHAPAIGSVPSKTIVHWHDRTTLQSRPAVDDDIAILFRQGGREVVQEIDYSNFVCDGDLANTIAARDQRSASAMPKRLTLRALRTMADLYETAVIKITYPALNIESMIVRVVSIDRGSLSDGTCIINVVEDVFGQGYTSYGSPPAAETGSASETLTEQLLDTEGYSVLRLWTGPTILVDEDGTPLGDESGEILIE